MHVYYTRRPIEADPSANYLAAWWAASAQQDLVDTTETILETQ